MAAAKKTKDTGKQQQKQPQSDSRPLVLEASKLAAALSYLVDVTPEGNRYHGWRVALTAVRIAQEVAPESQQEVFYTGLLHDIGSVSAYEHITRYLDPNRPHGDDAQIRSHPVLGAAMLDWLPGMREVARAVRAHHERWDGSGYPDGKLGKFLPQAAQIVAVADAAEGLGTFHLGADLPGKLRELARRAGTAWPRELWSALVGTTTDSEYYSRIIDPTALPGLMSEKLKETGLFEELDSEEGVERLLHLFAVVVDHKDLSAAGHSLRTARYAKALVEHMGLPEHDVVTAYRVGLVHDCGRVGIPTEVINRCGRLSDRELRLVREHAQMTIAVLDCLPDTPDMTELGRLAGHDHERWDGGGYPDRLAGEQIPLISRALSVVDAFDAMTSSTSYRMLSPKCAVLRLRESAGTQFDPDAVEAMVSALQTGALIPLTENRRAA